MGPEVGLEGCPPTGAVMCRENVWHPTFALGSSKVAVEFLLLLYLTIHTLPQLNAHSYFQSLLVSLYLLLKETFVQVQALQPRVTGQSLSQGPLRTVVSVPGVVCLEKKEYLLPKSSPHSDQGHIQRILAMMQKPKFVGYIGSALRIHLCAAVAKTKRWGGRI